MSVTLQTVEGGGGDDAGKVLDVSHSAAAIASIASIASVIASATKRTEDRQTLDQQSSKL